MAAVFFLIALGLGGAALLFRNAHEQVYFGTSWATDVCTTSHYLCQHPDYLGYGGGAVMVLAIGAGIGRILGEG
jgi:hypothetical protein